VEANVRVVAPPPGATRIGVQALALRRLLASRRVASRPALP
jgi:hypothetical protein